MKIFLFAATKFLPTEFLQTLQTSFLAKRKRSFFVLLYIKDHDKLQL